MDIYASIKALNSTTVDPPYVRSEKRDISHTYIQFHLLFFFFSLSLLLPLLLFPRTKTKKKKSSSIELAEMGIFLRAWEEGGRRRAGRIVDDWLALSASNIGALDWEEQVQQGLEEGGGGGSGGSSSSSKKSTSTRANNTPIAPIPTKGNKEKVSAQGSAWSFPPLSLLTLTYM